MAKETAPREAPLHPDFASALSASIGEAAAKTVLEALRAPASVSIRLNPSKLQACPFPGATPLEWNPWAYILGERPVFTLDPLFHAGCYYVQDTSAMLPLYLLRQLSGELSPGVRMLDLCAAPGGKTTDAAASLRNLFGDGFCLIANEVMRQRFGVLQDNVERWGDPCVGVISRDPSAFVGSPLFDIILADVPCSGEGMFRKDPVAVKEWTPELVDFCAARSRRILRDIWPSLCEGGLLLYSTCTFNRKENDETVAWIASELGADVLRPSVPGAVLHTEFGYLMLPGLVPGEGQYAAVLRKRGGEARRGNPVLALNPLFPKPEGEGPVYEVDGPTALRYLHGDALVLGADAPLGPLRIAFHGQVLGPAKNLGKRCNNLYPKGKRIRMDVQ